MPHEYERAPRRPTVWDRTPYHLDWLIRQTLGERINVIDHESDPTNARASDILDLTRTGRLVIGRIVDGLPFLGIYRVILDHHGGPIPCCAIDTSSYSSMGPHSIFSYQPNSRVLVYFHPTYGYGLILGGIPEPTHDFRFNRSDFVSQIGRGIFGFFKDNLRYSYPDKNIIDFSSFRPTDQNLGMEWGAMSDTGVGIVLDPFMAFIRADEETGLFVFYIDSLARLTGHNLEINSFVEQYIAYNDQYESHIVEGTILYPWESMGLKQPGQPFKINNNPGTGPDSWVEPHGKTALPFFRHVRYRGYLGQGEKRILMTWPRQEQSGLFGGSYAPGGGIAGNNSQTWGYGVGGGPPVGLFDESLTVPGRYGIRSAKSISIVKSPYIVVPKPKKPVFDDQGDNESNYQFSGVAGGGQRHIISDPELMRAGGVDEKFLNPTSYAMAALALHGFFFNYESLQGFRFHENDWEVVEEGSLYGGGFSGTGSAGSMNFSELRDNPFMSLPSTENVWIDHRYGEVKIYLSNAYLSLVDDGSVVLGDGYGSEIRLSGGNVYITAPGDVFLQSGRNTVTLAGCDAITKAKNCIDLSATDNDIRIKAERNLHVLSANSGSGGMLFECRSAEFEKFDIEERGEKTVTSGIVFKTPCSQLVAYAAEIYMRTNINDAFSQKEVERGGDIILDAAKGHGIIRSVSWLFERILMWKQNQGGSDKKFVGGARDIFVDPLNPPQSSSQIIVNSWGPLGSVIGTPVCVAGSVHVFKPSGYNSERASQIGEGDVYVEGKVLLVNPETERCKGFFNDEQGGASEAVNQITTNFYATQDMITGQQNKDKLGEGQFAYKIQFMFRSTKGYGTEKWLLPLTRFQMIEPGLEKWQEKGVPVLILDTEEKCTFPYPGKWWGVCPTDQQNQQPQTNLENGLIKIDLNMVDIKTGAGQSPDKNSQRIELIENAEIIKPDEGYGVICNAES